MGAMFTVLWRRVFSHRALRLLLLGLDAAGKTTILYRLKLGEVVSTIPTIGFNVEQVNHGNCSLTMWDVGRTPKVLMRHYYAGTNGLVFVIDSYDHSRLEEAKNELSAILREDELRNAALLVLANKQDLPGALKPMEVAERLELASIRGKQWFVSGCCAITGEGLWEGVQWLATYAVRVVMGSPYSSLLGGLPAQSCMVLMVGMDFAGKTTFLYTLRLGQVETTIPAIGFNCETLRYRSVAFVCWDIGGNPKIRGLVLPYYSKTNILVYMVDSTDRYRTSEIREEFENLVFDTALAGVPVLVLLNKCDIKGGVQLHEVIETLRLRSLRGRQCYAIECSAATGLGVDEAIRWIVQVLARKAAQRGVLAA